MFIQQICTKSMNRTWSIVNGKLISFSDNPIVSLVVDATYDMSKEKPICS